VKSILASPMLGEILLCTYNDSHKNRVMPLQDPDKLFTVVQHSTKNHLHSFRDKSNALRDCSEDIRLLIREGI
jgi:hypothetical protein